MFQKSTKSKLHAVENAKRELATRFDFRGVEASFEYNDGVVKVKAEGDFQIQQMIDILRNNCVKRGVDTASIELKDSDHTNKTYTQNVVFKEGIEQAVAKKIVKIVKDAKIKVQTAIQGEQLRVTGKKRDDLQQVMALVRESNLGQPFQFTNFRD